MRRTLNAAVFRDGDPRAAEAARTVPARASIIKFGDCVAGYMHRPAKTRKFSLDAMRLREIESIALYRHQDAPPSPDEARALARAISDHASGEAAAAWIDRWCVTLDEREREAIVAASAIKRTSWKADSLAALLGVTSDERTALGLRTIGATDITKRERTIARKVADRDRKRAARAAQSVKAISQNEAAPWRAAGISRATWFRLKAKTNVPRVETENVRSTVRYILRTKSVSRRFATLSATSADRVLQAIHDNGPVNVAAIVERTGLHHRIVRPLVSRLLRSNKIVRLSRGTYGAIEPKGVATAQRESRARLAPATQCRQRIAPTRIGGLAKATMKVPRPVGSDRPPPGHAGALPAGFEDVHNFPIQHFRCRMSERTMETSL